MQADLDQLVAKTQQKQPKIQQQDW
jgi:hypothetical protein